MEHIRQNKLNNCGQTCLRMITGKSLSDIEKLAGKNGKTHGTDLRKCLGELGYRFSDKMLRMPPRLLEVLFETQRSAQMFICMVKSTKRKNTGHWVVFFDKYVYDPAYGNKIRIRSYLKQLVKHDKKITSYMAVIQ